MKQLFILAIAVLAFAKSNGQDSLEMKNSIDSIIGENGKKIRSVNQKTRTTPAELRHLYPQKPFHNIWIYEWSYDNVPFKYSSIYLDGTDTIFIATYYFNNKKLVKASRLFYDKPTRKKEFEQTVYLQNDKIIFSSFFDPENKARFFDKDKLAGVGKTLRKMILKSLHETSKLTETNFDF